MAADLRLVSAFSSDYGLKGRVEAALIAHSSPEQVRYLHGRVFLVRTTKSPEDIEGWLTAVLGPDDRLFVVAIGDWSARLDPALTQWLRPSEHA